MPEIFIYDAIRTPRAKTKQNAALYSVTPLKLLSTQLQALAKRNQLNTSLIEDMSIGCVTQTLEQGACIARTAVIDAGYAEEVPACTVNRFCGSGVEAIFDISAKIASGFCDIAIAGGVESMSRVPMGADQGALLDAQQALKYGLVPQGISADLLATLHQISRHDCDTFAYQSQMYASLAQKSGFFDQSIVPVCDALGMPIISKDDYLRDDCTMEGLLSLKPAFETLGKQFGLDELTKQRYPFLSQIHHVHTAGNSSGVVDGASVLLLGNQEAQSKLQKKAKAKIKSIATIGSEPVVMLSAVVTATEKALKKAGLSIDQIDHFEVNEAFAVVPLYFMKHFKIPREKINPWGGAIALGHPLGATGAMLVNQAMDALAQKQQKYALVTLCIGGGMGIALILERVED